MQSSPLWSRDEERRVEEFLSLTAADFADCVEAVSEEGEGVTRVRIVFYKNRTIVGRAEALVTRDEGGNISRVDLVAPLERQVPGCNPLSDPKRRAEVLGWHYYNSESAVAKRLLGLEVLSLLSADKVEESRKIYNMFFPECPLTIQPYGYFDGETGEYVITRPDTPTPWINYIGQGGYGGIISNTGGGYSFDRDPRNRRVTRYRYNAIPVDQPGHYVYIRDEDTGEFWSPTWQPVGRRLDWYECRHGPGYTRITGLYKGVEASILYFVPPNPPRSDCPVQLHLLELKNRSENVRRLRIWTYEELCYWDAFMDLTNLDWAQQIVSSYVVDGVIVAGVQFRTTRVFFASSEPPCGYDTDRETFVGPCGDLSRPQVVVYGRSGYSLAARGNNIASLSHLVELKPGESKTIVYILGITDNPNLIPETVEYYRRAENAMKAFEDLKRNWENYLSKLRVETPDEELNAMINFWNAIQCRANLYWSRFASLYDTGLSRGFGTRDSAQDTLGTVHAEPERVKGVLKMLWRLQFKDGHTWHLVFPLTGEGGPGHAAEMPWRPQWFSDDHLWLIYATCNYIRETGDFGFLEEKIPYQDGGEETVWDHVLRAVEFTLRKRGSHGLPLLGFADWDDTMNLDHGTETAESVWTAMLFCRVMLDLAELSEARGDRLNAERFRQLYREMADTIDKVAWDGEWYARAFDDKGRPVGVKGEKYHWISLIPQAWAAIAEVGGEERERKALESAVKLLGTPLGLRLMRDPINSKKKSLYEVDYDSLDRFGGTATYPPGLKENGGIFNHASTWAIIAAAKLGFADLAYKIYRQMLPLKRKDSDTMRTEPYVYAQNIAAPEHPQFGLARNSWLTGTASWMYVAVTQWILGVKPTFHGLRVAPCIPENWNGFKVTRVFRGVTYNISVKRVGKGDTLLLKVNGEPVQGGIIPLPRDGVESVEVEVELGNPS
ncbi:MAG: hypothetical protein NZ954_06870 [Thermofilaceae archaeon]|nr:hypothetical protein [Thermofilaceae archaeon]MCX8179771.1 hypothetical protein [Thermofilaceae archaeon]